MNRRSGIWSYAIGLAFFAISLGIFLPFAAAIASGNGDRNPALTQICAIGGVKIVSPSSTAEIDDNHISQGHEYCATCVVCELPLSEIGSELQFYAKSTGLIPQKFNNGTYPDHIALYSDPIRGPPIH